MGELDPFIRVIILIGDPWAMPTAVEFHTCGVNEHIHSSCNHVLFKYVEQAMDSHYLYLTTPYQI